MKTKIKENLKEELIFKSKEAELRKKLEEPQKLQEESSNVEKIFKTTKDSDDNMKNKVNYVLSTIIDHLDRNELVSQFPQDQRPRKIESSALKTFSTSMILSSCKKPLSTKKNKVTSSRRNIFESVNNLFSGSRRRNDRINATFMSSTMLSSICSVSTKLSDKSLESNTVLDASFLNNNELQKCVENIWVESNRSCLWECLNDMRVNDKNKLMSMVAESKT